MPIRSQPGSEPNVRVMEPKRLHPNTPQGLNHKLRPCCKTVLVPEQQAAERLMTAQSRRPTSLIGDPLHDPNQARLGPGRRGVLARRLGSPCPCPCPPV